MDIKLFSLIKGDPAACAPDKRIISECANAFSSENEKFKNFSSMKRVFLAASQALRSAEVIIIAVQSGIFNSAKKALCASLKLESEQNIDIANAIGASSGQNSESVIVNHSTFPKGAEIFATHDLKYCGFSVSSGSQSIILVPLDTLRTSEVVFGSLFDYLAAKASINDKAELSKLKRFCTVKRDFDVLSSSGRTVCIAETNAASALPETVRLVDAENKVFRFSPVEPKNPMQSANDYIVAAAKNARAKSSSTYGCAVSNAFSSSVDNSVFSLFAIADKEKTSVTKVFIRNGETPKELISHTTEKMLETIGSTEISSIKKSKERSNKASRRLRRQASSIIAFAVGGSAAICALLTFLLGQ